MIFGKDNPLADQRDVALTEFPLALLFPCFIRPIH